MPLRLLLGSQRDQVFQLLVAHAFDPRQFDWHESGSLFVPGLRVSVLSHEPSEDYWFKFDWAREAHAAAFSPGEDRNSQQGFPGDWPGQLGYVENWLNNLRRELETPDFWASVGAISTRTEPPNNASFSPAEIQAIDERLGRIEARIGEMRALQAGEAAYVHEALEEVKASARTFGRKDWINLATGALMNLILFLGIPPDAAGSLFKYATDIFQSFGAALGTSSAASAALPHPQPGPPPAAR